MLEQPKPEIVSPSRRRQTEIYVTGLGGRRPLVPVAAEALERAALIRMSGPAAAYVAGAAGSESTAKANRTAFEGHRLVPRVLTDASQRDLSVSLFGRTLAAPILLAPVGVLELVHRQADLAVARAAAAENVPLVFSNQASVPMEACAEAMKDGPRWFQLYWSRDDGVVRSFVERAERCGCEAIVVTMDTALLGWRPRDLDLGYLPFLRGLGLAQYLTDPAFLASLPDHPPVPDHRPRGLDLLTAVLALRRSGRQFGLGMRKTRCAVAQFIATYSRPDLQWPDLERLRGMTSLPILLKGVLHPEDARRAVAAGVDGIIVSNHGGRQVDGAIAALDALPAVVAAAEDKPVLLDSGIRTGADIVKALALGARAVLVGRPYVYGLALAGEAGVREVIRNFVAELDLTLALCGLRSVRDIDRSVLEAGSIHPDSIERGR